MAVDTALIQKLRDDTGAGILDVKKALLEAKNDYEKAVEILRKRGKKVAAKKAERSATQGVVEAYIHGSRVGVLVRLNCETDFVARTDTFKQLAHQLAMHVAAFNPTTISRADVSEDVIEKEKDIHRTVLKAEGKKNDIIEKILKGKLDHFFAETCLLEQPFIMDEERTVQDVINEKIAELGENIQVTAFKRIAL